MPQHRDRRREGARAVRAVALHGAAQIDHDQRAGGNHDVSWHRVRQRAVLGRSHYRRERDLVGALVLGSPLECARNRDLRVAGQPMLVDEPAVEAIGDLGRPAHQLQLPVVLHRPQLLHEAARGHQLRARRKDPGQPLMRLHGHVRVVEANSRAVTRLFPDDLRDLLEQVLLSPHQLEVGTSYFALST